MWLHLEPDRALDILVADFGAPVGPRQNDSEPVLAVPLFQRRRHAAGVAHGRQLLIHDEHDLGRQSPVSRAPPESERGTSSTVYRCVRLAKSSSARIRGASKARVTGRPEAPSRSSPPLLRTTIPLKNAASRRCTFSSASMTEKRGSAPRNTAASPHATFRSISSVDSGVAFASDVATLTATVVAPTPPLAPMIAKTSPRVAGHQIAHEPLDRRLKLGDSAIGWVTHSLTPARIASSIKAGSSFESDQQDARRRDAAV